MNLANLERNFEVLRPEDAERLKELLRTGQIPELEADTRVVDILSSPEYANSERQNTDVGRLDTLTKGWAEYAEWEIRGSDMGEISEVLADYDTEYLRNDFLLDEGVSRVLREPEIHVVNPEKPLGVMKEDYSEKEKGSLLEELNKYDEKITGDTVLEFLDKASENSELYSVDVASKWNSDFDNLEYYEKAFTDIFYNIVEPVDPDDNYDNVSSEDRAIYAEAANREANLVTLDDDFVNENKDIVGTEDAAVLTPYHAHELFD